MSTWSKTNYKFINNTGELPNQHGIIGVAPGLSGSINPSLDKADFSTEAGKLLYNQVLELDKINKKLPINNTQIPLAAMSIAGANPYAAAAMYALNGIASGLTSVQDNESLISDAGSSQANANGIGYQRLNVVSAGSVIGDYNKQTVQSLMTNPFEAATRWLMGGSQKKEALLAQSKSLNIANDQAAGALTKSLRLSNAKTYGDSSSQYLYGAKNGKLPKFSEGLIASPFGELPSSAGANARVSIGEILGKLDPFGNVESVYRVPGKKNNNDTKLAKLANGKDPADDTFVITNKHGLSDYAAATGDYLGALEMQKSWMMNDKNTDLLFRAKCGKLPKFAEGWWGNAIPAAIGSLQSIDQYLQARRNKPYRPNTYADNPYELDALSTFAGLRVNPYPIMQQLRNAETRTNRAIDRSGGLSVAQRNLSRLAALNNTLTNIGNTLASIQQLNNQYKANYAQAALNAGQNARQARMQANQWDLDYYSKAHAAQLNGMQTGLRNILGQVQGYQQNEFKRRQFNDMMGLYRNDLKIRMDELNTLANQSNYDYARWLLLARQNNWKLPA